MRRSRIFRLPRCRVRSTCRGGRRRYRTDVGATGGARREPRPHPTSPARHRGVAATKAVTNAAGDGPTRRAPRTTRRPRRRPRRARYTASVSRSVNSNGPGATPSSRTMPSARSPDRLTTTRWCSPPAPAPSQRHATSRSADGLSGQPSTATGAHVPRRNPSPSASSNRSYHAWSVGVERLGRPTPERHRHPHPSTVGLTLVQQRHPWQRQGDHGRRPPRLGSEHGSHAGLVVVLDEPHRVPLVGRIGAAGDHAPTTPPRHRRAGRRAACRSRHRSPARPATVRGPSRPRPRTRNRGGRRALGAITVGQ